MSEMEFHKGKIIPVDLNGKSVGEVVKKLCENQSWDISEYDFERIDGYDYCFDEFLEDTELEGKLAIINNKLFMIEDEEYDPYHQRHTNVNDNGEIEYNVSFYNGGACLSEMLEAIVNDIEKEQEDGTEDDRIES